MSLQWAHFSWRSKPAIRWPQLPLRWPGDTMTIKLTKYPIISTNTLIQTPNVSENVPLVIQLTQHFRAKQKVEVRMRTHAQLGGWVLCGLLAKGHYTTGPGQSQAQDMFF